MIAREPSTLQLPGDWLEAIQRVRDALRQATQLLSRATITLPGEKSRFILSTAQFSGEFRAAEQRARALVEEALSAYVAMMVPEASGEGVSEFREVALKVVRSQVGLDIALTEESRIIDFPSP